MGYQVCYFNYHVKIVRLGRISIMKWKLNVLLLLLFSLYMTVFDERVGEEGDPSERSSGSRRCPHPAAPSGRQVRRGVYDGLADAMALASPADPVPRDALATRRRLSQLLRGGPKVRAVVHHVRIIHFFFSSFFLAPCHLYSSPLMDSFFFFTAKTSCSTARTARANSHWMKEKSC